MVERKPFEVERRNGIGIVRFLDSIEIYEAAQIRSEILQWVSDSDIRGVIFSFADVPYIDSSGVGVFVNLHRQLERRVPLRFCHVSDTVQDVLRYTRLVSLFAIDETEAESIARIDEHIERD